MSQMTKRMRWIVLGFLLALSIINFIDRQTLSVLAPHLRQLFHLSNTDYGRIVAAFSFGMMAAEFPMGMLMDRLGARFGLAFAVMWWSLATAAHAVGNSARSFGLFRFWMGTGETGTFSGSLKVITRWFPKDERTFAIGAVNSGTMLGLNDRSCRWSSPSVTSLAGRWLFCCQQRWGLYGPSGGG